MKSMYYLIKVREVIGIYRSTVVLTSKDVLIIMIKYLAISFSYPEPKM
jgi:hypothetical protein